MQKTVQYIFQYIEENHMIGTDERVLAGVSGGADSICLLFVLRQWAEQHPCSIAVLHVHHGIRGGEADRDMDFVQEVCRAWQIPCFTVKKDVPALARQWKVSEEAAGRRVRYEELEKTAKEWGASKIAVAHHRDDNEETVLLHLFRGSGLKGLAGMQPVNGSRIRPLLCVGRKEIEEILTEAGLSWCTDSTNLTDEYLRNRIRRNVIPCLRENISPAAPEKLLETARLAAEADSFLTRLAQAEEGRAFVKQAAGLLLTLRFPELDPALQHYVVREAVRELKGELTDFGSLPCSLICELFVRQCGRGLDLPDGIQAKRVYEGVLLRKEKKGEACSLPGDRKVPPAETEASEAPLSENGPAEGRPSGKMPGPAEGDAPEGFGLRDFPRPAGENFPEKKYTKWFDYDTIENRPVFRHRRPGDWIAIAPSGRKSLKKYLIDEKIPASLREDLWLLADGSRILWVVGRRISEDAKVTEKTERILEASFRAEENA